MKETQDEINDSKREGMEEGEGAQKRDVAVANEEKRAARLSGIYGFMEEGACKKDRRTAQIKQLTGAHLIECCRRVASARPYSTRPSA